MEEYRKEAWQEIVTKVQAAGVDGLELNLSCPHGLPERKMGAAMGQDCQMTQEVCGWVKEVTTVPFWAKIASASGSSPFSRAMVARVRRLGRKGR